MSTRDQILDAAAYLFVTTGYSHCTTREIAARVGIRQASMYHHFRSKAQLLQVLMMSSIMPSLEVAQRLCTPEAVAADPLATLYALIVADVRTLAALPHNAAILYDLPDVREHPDFADFRAQREHLTTIYGSIAAKVTTAMPEHTAGVLVMQLVESVIRFRTAETFRAEDEDVIASACLGTLMVNHEQIAATAHRAHALLYF